MRSEIKCLPQTVDDWSDLDTVGLNMLPVSYSMWSNTALKKKISSQVRGSSTSDWQVMFHRHEEHLLPMNLTAARKQGYAFDLTKGRLVFRTPYGQPDSFSTEVTR